MSTNDPSNYAKLNVPMENVDAILDAFQDELYALRQKYKIPDVYCITRVQKPNGNDLVSILNYGNGSLALKLTATAYGFEKKRAEKALQDIIDGATE